MSEKLQIQFKYFLNLIMLLMFVLLGMMIIENYQYTDIPNLDEFWSVLSALGKVDYGEALPYLIWLKGLSFVWGNFESLIQYNYIILIFWSAVSFFFLLRKFKISHEQAFFWTIIMAISPVTLLVERRLIFFTIVVAANLFLLIDKIRNKVLRCICIIFSLWLLGKIRSEFNLGLLFWLLYTIVKGIILLRENYQKDWKYISLVSSPVLISIFAIYLAKLLSNPFDVVGLILFGLKPFLKDKTVVFGNDFFKFSIFLIQNIDVFLEYFFTNLFNYLKFVSIALFDIFLDFKRYDLLFIFFILIVSRLTRLEIKIAMIGKINFLLTGFLFSLFVPICLVRLRVDYYPYFFVIVVISFARLLNHTPMRVVRVSLLIAMLFSLFIPLRIKTPENFNILERWRLFYRGTPNRDLIRIIKSMHNDRQEKEIIKLISAYTKFEYVLPERGIDFYTTYDMYRAPEICYKNDQVFDLVHIMSFHLDLNLPLFTECVLKNIRHYYPIYQKNGAVIYINSKYQKIIEENANIF